MTETSDAVKEVEVFAHAIGRLRDNDYGDWMREANVHWWRLFNALENDDRVDDLLAEIHGIIQYHPSWKESETKRHVIELALEMRRRLGGKNGLQVHDFDVSLSEEDPPEGPLPEKERPYFMGLDSGY